MTWEETIVRSAVVKHSVSSSKVCNSVAPSVLRQIWSCGPNCSVGAKSIDAGLTACRDDRLGGVFRFEGGPFPIRIQAF